MAESLVDFYRAQIWPPAGTDAQLARHLASVYGSPVTAVAALDAGVFSADFADGGRWIARIFPPARPPANTEGDAAIFRFLETQQFPAERCADVNAVSSMNGRTVLVTRRVDGESARSTRVARLFRTLGDLLGQFKRCPSTIRCGVQQDPGIISRSRAVRARPILQPWIDYSPRRSRTLPRAIASCIRFSTSAC